ncbi:hypothetical protein KOW79_006736 [Hemibagrus wyckioides]|uniref:Uncharacterized protein n=1 Tax=Hemibagrus wyckioides TaxID=337641 RepID=A0A9D3SSS7_9TELE|nr:hypothetical protein KOW79_006736 [Hemibagrus wyckioides]
MGEQDQNEWKSPVIMDELHQSNQMIFNISKSDPPKQTLFPKWELDKAAFPLQPWSVWARGPGEVDGFLSKLKQDVVASVEL